MWNMIIIAPFVNTLLLITKLVGNFGIAIILFTLLIRVVTHPLTVKQLKGTQAMQDLQSDPRYIKMQEKYKDDKEKLSQEQMKLYQEMGISPFSSCLPTLIQFPIIIGLYQAVIRALSSTPMEMLNLTRFIYPVLKDLAGLVPLNNQFLWMDLSQPERVFIPGLNIGIPVLAVLVVITSYLQSKLMTPPPSAGNEQAAMMSNMMSLYMPFLMGYLAYTLASGLALYFLASSVVGVAQYALMGKLHWENLKLFQKPSSVKTISKK
jgi:YidC/Oxa1 family membrane protein insertase